MRRYRHLFAILLVVVYAVSSTVGMAFIGCLEADGTLNIESLGSSCCVGADEFPATALADAVSVATDASQSEDCGDCQSHTPAIDVTSPTIEDAQAEQSPPVQLPPAALPGRATSTFDEWRTVDAPSARPLPPRPCPTLARLRTVCLRC